MPNASIEISGRPEPLVVQINGVRPTFRLESDAISAHRFEELCDRHNDLLEIASAVFFADGSITRGGSTRPEMGRAWRRTFFFKFHVRDIEFWEQPKVQDTLQKAIEFLTDDRVTLEFTRLDPRLRQQPYLPLARTGPVFKADRVILFSGGLDSFAGALETLSKTTDRVVLVTHRSAQKAIPRQVELGRFLSERFPGRVLHLNVMARRVGAEAVDSTQRSRSLLFSALGHAAAHALGARQIDVFENGIVSHNLPLSSQIVGTMATRTTHPQALRYLSDLLAMVGPRGLSIENKYAWYTKSEVVRRIAENGGAPMIARTVSCTSTRDQTNLHTHCGACTQCLDRRFGILAAELGDYDFASDYATEVLTGPRETGFSKTLAYEWTRHANELADLDETGFVLKFGQELSRIQRGHPDRGAATVIRQTVEMHQRHGQAVRKALAVSIRDLGDELAAGRVPASSLIRTWLGNESDEESLASPVLTRATSPPLASLAVDCEQDLVPDPEAPLRVTFARNGRSLEVSVEGLGVVSGAPARVPHALKRYFDDDRAEARNPSDHRFVRLKTIHELEDLDARSLRQNVRRCRQVLAENFEFLHGRKPDAPLLIQNKQNLGYRLDPTIDAHESLG